MIASFWLEGIMAKSSVTPARTLFRRDRISSLMRSHPGGQNFSHTVTIMSRSVMVPSKSQKTASGLAMTPQCQSLGEFGRVFFRELFEILFLEHAVDCLTERARAGAGAFRVAVDAAACIDDDIGSVILDDARHQPRMNTGGRTREASAERSHR